MKDALSLIELNGLVRKSIETCLPSTYWVRAELSDVRTNASGHCYMEFVQKNEQTAIPIAKARGMIWASLFNMLKPYFEESTGEAFRSGLNVLVEVEVKFHELYGYSLVVVNIDPTYTVGDLVKRKQVIIKQLEEEGVIDLNKETELSILPQRVAVISSQTAAGYGDFCDQLLANEYGIPFYVELFPAIMQGEQVERTILEALDKVFERRAEFDLVVIIRGGGATSDLSGFDTYLLAAGCAQFPLPILTGIGHERDDTVLDVVAYKSVKTPTAAAEFLIARVLETKSTYFDLVTRFHSAVKDIMYCASQELKDLQISFPSTVKLAISDHKYQLSHISSALSSSTKYLLSSSLHKLESLKQYIDSSSPELILKRGYAIIRQNNNIVTTMDAINTKEVIEIQMKDGSVYTKVNKE